MQSLLEVITSKSAAVIRRGKRSFNRQSGLAIADAYQAAREEALENIFAPEASEGIAAFLEKRDPVW